MKFGETSLHSAVIRTRDGVFIPFRRRVHDTTCGCDACTHDADTHVHVWNEEEHPRGQPENAGEFAKGKTTRLAKSEIIRGETETGTPVTAVVNPSAGKLAQLLKASPKPTYMLLRALAVGDDVVVGHANDVTHEDMIRFLRNAAHPLADQAQKLHDSPRNHLQIWASSIPHELPYELPGLPGYSIGVATSFEIEKPSSLPLALRRVLVYHHTADAFRESEHPRGGRAENRGEFSKGQGSGATKPAKAKLIPKLDAKQFEGFYELGYGGGPEAKKLGIPPHSRIHGSKISLTMIQTLAIAALNHRELAGEIGKQIISTAAKYVHSYNAFYANEVLHFIETKHGLIKGTLGYAYAKGATQGVKQPKTLQEAVTGKKETEARFHTDAFRHATPELLAVIANANPVYVDRTSSYGQYAPVFHTISIPKDAEGERALGMWRHEYGHAIDYDGSSINDSQGYFDELQQDATALTTRNHLPELKAAIGLEESDLDSFVAGSSQPQSSKDIVRRVLSGVPKSLILSTSREYEKQCYWDFVGAVTNNAIGHGHSNEYYATDPARTRCGEAFAEYVALTQSEHGKVWRAMLHALAPRACQGFDAILTKRASVKSKALAKWQ